MERKWSCVKASRKESFLGHQKGRLGQERENEGKKYASKVQNGKQDQEEVLFLEVIFFHSFRM
jgi:hypothetical protein